MSGKFFAIGRSQWAEACKLGLNPAVAFLVLACGTGCDNVTTTWSAKAVQTYTGIGWVRAKESLAALARNPRILASVTSNGKLRRRKLVIPQDAESVLWLPNSLVTGVGAELPPVAKLRQAQNLEHLQTFIELYGVHDLAGDGGLPRSLIRKQYDLRQCIGERGPFNVWSFYSIPGSRYHGWTGPFARFQHRKGKLSALRECWDAFDRMGLWESVDYLAEGESPDSELLHTLAGDDHAQEVADAARWFAAELPAGLNRVAYDADYVLPVPRHIREPAVVGIYRLVYRPQTRLTAAWHAQHMTACEEYAKRYRALAVGDFDRAVRTG